MAASGSDLLQASLSGNLPPEVEYAFSTERERGNAAYREGRLDAAIDYYTKAEVINPLSPLPPANRSMVYLKMGQWQKAREEAAVALELQNALPVDLHSKSLTTKLFLRRATACKNLMLFALAADDYESVLEVDPAHAIAKEELQELRRKYRVAPSRRVNPSTSVSLANAQHSTPRDLVTDVSESNGHVNVGDGARARPHTPKKPVLRDSIQHDAPLFSLPTNTTRQLVTQWSHTAPESGSHFEHVWRTLSNDPSAQARYLLHTVGASRVRSGLIGDGLTPQMLENVPCVLTTALNENIATHDEIADMLLAFSGTSRFSLLMMFLSSGDRAPFVNIINSLKDHGVSSIVIRRLQESYG